jgi:hypothetical protein
MKTVNVKTALISLLIGFVMISCGGGSGKKDGKIDAEAIVKQQIKEAATQTEITEANWQNVIKKRFGVELAVPQGWTFTDVKSYFDGKTVIVNFKQEGDNAALPRDIAQTIFAAVKDISTEGNFNVDVKINAEGTSGTTSKGTVYESYEQCDPTNKFLGEQYINGFWYYVKDGVKVVTLGSDKGVFVVKFEISQVKI